MVGKGAERLSLSQRFAIAGAVVLLAGSLVIGTWVVQRITAEVTENAAISTALLVDSIIAPLAQELKTDQMLSIGPARGLDEILRSTTLSDRIVSFKLWRPDGTIAYSDDFDLIGRKFPPSEALEQAASGDVVAEMDAVDDAESARERALGIPLLEIYSPVRERWTGDVIAVAEFYEDGRRLNAMLENARWSAIIVVGGTTGAMALILFGIVVQGSRTIERQKIALKSEIARAEATGEQNRTLKERVERAYTLSTELNERYLRRVSADLHDGPAQLVGLASLRIGSLRDAADTSRRHDEAMIVQQVLAEAMTDIRSICSGLSLPHIEKQSLADIVWEVVRAHERYTGTAVDMLISGAPPDLSLHAKICVYRFVQEGLNNAFHHARDAERSVSCHCEHGILHVSVINGPFQPPETEATRTSGHLGLEGLRARVEAIGGVYSFEAFPETGTRLEMSVEVGRVMT